MLHAARPQETRALRTLVEQAAATGAGTGTSPGGATALRRPSLRRPLNVSVMPVRGGRGGLPSDLGARSPAAIVMITDPGSVPEPAETALRQLYGLTAAEATLAKALAAGKSIQDYADDARVSYVTARWRLKQVFAKTDTRRQPELVRLVLTSAVLIQPCLSPHGGCGASSRPAG